MPVRKILVEMRRVIQEAAPGAEERISYGIPTFYLNENLVHFAGYKNHIGFYPGPAALAAFESELAGFATSRGTVQFPLEQKIPWRLITKIVRFRVKAQKSASAPVKKAKKVNKVKNSGKLKG